MEKSYKTKQRAAILEYLKNNVDNHITADNIIEYFSIYDEYTKITLRYCPRDAICENDKKIYNAAFCKVEVL